MNVPCMRWSERCASALGFPGNNIESAEGLGFKDGDFWTQGCGRWNAMIPVNTSLKVVKHFAELRYCNVSGGTASEGR